MMLGHTNMYRGEELPVYGATSFFTRIVKDPYDDQNEPEVELCLVVEAEDRIIAAMRLTIEEVSRLSGMLVSGYEEAARRWDEGLQPR